MRCGDRRKFDVDRSKTKLSKNRQSTTSVHWRVGLKGLLLPFDRGHRHQMGPRWKQTAFVFYLSWPRFSVMYPLLPPIWYPTVLHQCAIRHFVVNIQCIVMFWENINFIFYIMVLFLIRNWLSSGLQARGPRRAAAQGTLHRGQAC